MAAAARPATAECAKHAPSAALFTHTNWNEPPRIRHQLARLLRDRGHPLLFFERCHHRPGRIARRREEGIDFIRHDELLNHQLLVHPLLRRANAALLKRRIRTALHNDALPEWIVNFNYDYSFLRELFPSQRIVTIINDDFPAQARLPFMRAGMTAELARTCRASDAVLTVSHPLRDQLLAYNADTHLFLPWAERPYRPPAAATSRDTALFWGYVNHRLDWPVLRGLAERGVRMRFVGPVEPSARRRLAVLAAFPNVDIAPATALSALRTDDVCCLLVPYNAGLDSVRACTVPNRAFNILALGVPIAITRLPHLIDAPSTVIRRCESTDDFMDAVAFFRGAFNAVQDDIAAFLHGHDAASRYAQLLGLLAQSIERD